MGGGRSCPWRVVPPSARVTVRSLRRGGSLLARSRLLGIPSVVLSAAVGTTLFATLGRNGASANLRIAAGLVSLFAAVLVALQTFLGLAELADKHRSAASTYGAIRGAKSNSIRPCRRPPVMQCSPQWQHCVSVWTRLLHRLPMSQSPYGTKLKKRSPTRHVLRGSGMRRRSRRCGCKPQLSSDRQGSCVSPLNSSARIGSLGSGILPLRPRRKRRLSQLCPDNRVPARPVTSRRVPLDDLTSPTTSEDGTLRDTSGLSGILPIPLIMLRSLVRFQLAPLPDCVGPDDPGQKRLARFLTEIRVMLDTGPVDA